MITALIALALFASSTGDGREPTRIGTGARTPFWHLSVLVMDTKGETLPGSNVELCLWDRKERACDADSQYDPFRKAATDSDGRASLTFIPQGEYGVRARYADSAETTIGPLGIGQVPIAPDEVVALVNWICHHHCTVPPPN